jgi:hypothetical protein
VKLVTRKFPVMQFILVLLVLTYFIIIAYLTPSLHPMTRLFPMIVIIFAIPIAIIELLTVVNQKSHDLFSETELIGKKSIEEKVDEIDLRSQAKAMSWMLLYVVLFFLVGPLIAMVIAPLVVMRYFGKMKWLPSLTVMALTWGVVYCVFVLLVGSRLPVGLIF